VEGTAEKRRFSRTTASFSNAGIDVKVRAIKTENPCAAGILAATARKETPRPAKAPQIYSSIRILGLQYMASASKILPIDRLLPAICVLIPCISPTNLLRPE